MTSGSQDQNERPYYAALYEHDLTDIPEPISKILEAYSGIPHGEQKEHILKLRNRAYEAHPYPCLGRFRFLELDLSTHPLYKEYVLPRLKEGNGQSGPIFLDLGTCLGQDLRKLIYDGVNPQQLYGADLVPAFIDAGYELFKDKGKFPLDHFVCPADVFDMSSGNKLSTMDGKADIVQAAAVFHLFDMEQQLAVARRCMRLLKKVPETRCLVLGGQAGNVNAKERVRAYGAKQYWHNEESWRKLWEEICSEEEFRDVVKKVVVQAELRERTMGTNSERNIEEGFRWMNWQVWVDF